MSGQVSITFDDEATHTDSTIRMLELAARAEELANLLTGSEATDELRVEHDSIMSEFRAFNREHQVFPSCSDEFPSFITRNLGFPVE